MLEVSIHRFRGQKHRKLILFFSVRTFQGVSSDKSNKEHATMTYQSYEPYKFTWQTMKYADGTELKWFCIEFECESDDYDNSDLYELTDYKDNYIIADFKVQYNKIKQKMNQKKFNREQKEKQKKINEFISSRLYNPRTPWGKIFVNNLYMKDC